MSKFSLVACCCFLVLGCAKHVRHDAAALPLSGLSITVDPGHGDTQAYDHFRLGPTGEREEWINLRVARALKRRLARSGAHVIMTRTRDKDVSLGGRAAMALQHDSDFFVSIHHNGSSDPEMDYPLVYFWGTAQQNPASVDLGIEVVGQMKASLDFNQPDLAGVFSDHIIYARGTSVLRNTYPEIPGIIGECGFFTHAPCEQRLKSRRYNQREADAYHRAILAYAAKGLPSATPRVSDDAAFVVDPAQPLVFDLDDGLGGHAFDPVSLHATIDEAMVPTTWNPDTGELSVTLPRTQAHKITVQVFGRNVRGNALHPRQWTFATPAGRAFRCTDSWATAYDMAKATDAELSETLSKSPTDREALRHLTQKARDLYQLSLQLQPVHLKALETEKRIVCLLELQQRLFPEMDLDEDIFVQKNRIDAYYPYVTSP